MRRAALGTMEALPQGRAPEPTMQPPTGGRQDPIQRRIVTVRTLDAPAPTDRTA